jgi:hypothetical protein
MGCYLRKQHSHKCLLVRSNSGDCDVDLQKAIVQEVADLFDRGACDRCVLRAIGRTGRNPRPPSADLPACRPAFTASTIRCPQLHLHPLGLAFCVKLPLCPFEIVQCCCSVCAWTHSLQRVAEFVAGTGHPSATARQCWLAVLNKPIKVLRLFTPVSPPGHRCRSYACSVIYRLEYQKPCRNPLYKLTKDLSSYQGAIALRIPASPVVQHSQPCTICCGRRGCYAAKAGKVFTLATVATTTVHHAVHHSQAPECIHQSLLLIQCSHHSLQLQLLTAAQTCRKAVWRMSQQGPPAKACYSHYTTLQHKLSTLP